MASQKPIRVIRAHQPFSDWLDRLWQRRETLWFFLWKDLKVQYQRPMLGVLWSVFQPLIYFAVILGVVHFSGRTSSGITMPFEVFLLCGLAIWNFTTACVQGGLNSMQSNAGLISKASFPRIYLVLAPFLKSLFDLAIMLLIVILAAVILRSEIHPELILALPVSVLLVAPVSLGLGCMAASLVVWNRQLRHAIPIVLYALIFVLPVFYSMNAVTNRWVQLLYGINPIGGAMDILRSGFGSFQPSGLEILIWFISSASFLTLGIGIFKRTEQRLADDI